MVVAVLMQLLASVPVTVYTVPTHKPLMIFPVAVPLGATVYTKVFGLIVAVPSQPGEQLAGVVEVTVGAAGDGGVVTVTVVVPEHPLASVPVTV